MSLANLPMFHGLRRFNDQIGLEPSCRSSLQDSLNRYHAFNRFDFTAFSVQVEAQIDSSKHHFRTTSSLPPGLVQARAPVSAARCAGLLRVSCAVTDLGMAMSQKTYIGRIAWCQRRLKFKTRRCTVGFGGRTSSF